MNDITKAKNPGRVESGRKLAAWNRENKAKLKAQQVPSNEVPAAHQQERQEPGSAPSLVPSNNSIVIGIAVVIGGVLWYKLRPFKAAKPAQHADVAQKSPCGSSNSARAAGAAAQRKNFKKLICGINKMDKEIIDSLWQALRLGGYTFLYAYGGKKIMGMTPPSAKLDFNDAGKLGAYLTVSILTDDYALKKGWYKDKISS